MSGIGIICFVSSYLIALCLEITRVFFRSAVRNVFVLLWVIAGLIAHTAYLRYHTVVFPEVDSAKTYFLISAWGLVIADVCLLYLRPKTPFGIVILPLVILLICGAVSAPGTSEAVQRTELSFLIQCRNFHTGTFLFATLALSIGFTAGVFYLIQDRQLRLKRPPFSLFLLPSLEWSMKICRYSFPVSLLFLTANIASGVLLKINFSTVKQVSVFDPIVFGTLVLFIALACVYRHLSNEKDKPNALTAILIFLFLAAVLTFAVLLNNSHWQGVIR